MKTKMGREVKGERILRGNEAKMLSSGRKKKKSAQEQKWINASLGR